VVALQAQSQAGRELSTLAPLRVLRARTPEPAWARRAVDEGVRACPRAGCRKSACFAARIARIERCGAGARPNRDVDVDRVNSVPEGFNESIEPRLQRVSPFRIALAKNPGRFAATTLWS
jgi:hypothetical protein